MITPKMLSSGKVLAVLAGLGAAFVVIYYLKKGAAAVVDTAKVALDPVNPNNIVNSAVTHLGAGISGNQNWTLGGWIYDVTHPAPATTPAVAPRKVLAVKKAGSV